MASDILSGLISGISPGKDSASGQRNGQESSATDAFSGFFRTFVNEADSASKAPRADKPATGQAGDFFSADDETVTMERIAKLTASGALKKKEIEKMDDDDWRDLEAWVLAGAGGMFEPIEPKVDLSGEVADGEEEGDGEGKLPDILGSLMALMDAMKNVEGGDGDAQDVADILSSIKQAGGDANAVLDILLGKGASEGLDLKAFGEAFIQAISQYAGDGEGDMNLEQALNAASELNLENLANALEKAASDLGIDIEVSENSLKDIPESVVKSLALKVVESGFGVEQESSGANLLKQLELNNELREKLAHAIEAAAGNAESSDAVAVGEETSADLSEENMNDEQLETDDAEKIDAKIGAKADGNTSNSRPEDPTLHAEDEPGMEKIHKHKGDENLAIDGNSDGDDDSAMIDDGIEAVAVKADVHVASDSSVAGEGSEHGVQQITSTQSTASASQAQAHAARESEYANSQMLENINRVEQVMRLSVKRGIQHVSLQLSPPDLGRVTLNLQMKNGVLNAEIRTENVDARQFLMSGLDQLKHNLQVQGIELEHFDVNLNGNGMSQGHEGAWGNGSNNNRGSQGGRQQQVETVETSAKSDSGAVWGDGALNVVA
ncbi:MAG: flagellar hook-length control protein FliK [Planctomycetes bacterium]|nr:flagellar hook-length control protein FliK [Planctomycetota bacterium]